ncbi:MAG: ribonucleoside-diphosphate reductase subunit alpha [Rickettsiales bacterium]|nr:MAG: ribonucleoside-diphosphate reductase subunit alpha [Rickettsiales bacterium]
MLSEDKILNNAIAIAKGTETKALRILADSMGHSTTSYNDHKMAGIFLMECVLREGPKNIGEYLEVMSHRLNKRTLSFMVSHSTIIDKELKKNYLVDLNFDWISASILVRSYLSRPQYGSAVFETPSIMRMRIAIQMCSHEGIAKVLDAYGEMNDKLYMPASPTMFNAGMMSGQMSSCFIMSSQDTSESILDNVKYTSLVSKHNGGYGLDVSRLRHSAIGSVGRSSGIIPMIKMYDSSTSTFGQTGKRAGAGTISCRLHHIDIVQFINVRSNEGSHTNRVFTVGTAIYTPWVFWERVRSNGIWSMFCPNLTKSLNDIYGIDFMKEYERIENSNVDRKTIKARVLLSMISESKRKCGYPYILNGDSCNYKSNQKHLGYIRSCNLCTEIIQYAPEDEITSCNLHSITLPSHMKDGTFDYSALCLTAAMCVNNLNNIIDNNFYVLGDKTKTNNLDNRPLGIGIQGFFDVVYLLDLLPNSNEVIELNKKIFACIYFSVLAASVDLAIKYGKCKGHDGSPMSEGKLQFDLWAEEYKLLKDNKLIEDSVRKEEDDIPLSPSEWGQLEIVLSNGEVIENTWESLRIFIIKYGLRNTLLTTIAPTATSAQLMGSCEQVECHQANIYSRILHTGNVTVINKYMYRDLSDIGVWSNEISDLIKADGGSISKLEAYVKSSIEDYENVIDMHRLRYVVKKYKTMYELSQKFMINLMADRSRYIDQSSSLNIYMGDPTTSDVTTAILYANAKGLKTIMYYLRRKAANKQPMITINSKIKTFVDGYKECLSCQ